MDYQAVVPASGRPLAWAGIGPTCSLLSEPAVVGGECAGVWQRVPSQVLKCGGLGVRSIIDLHFSKLMALCCCNKTLSSWSAAASPGNTQGASSILQVQTCTLTSCLHITSTQPEHCLCSGSRPSQPSSTTVACLLLYISLFMIVHGRQQANSHNPARHGLSKYTTWEHGSEARTETWPGWLLYRQNIRT